MAYISSSGELHSGSKQQWFIVTLFTTIIDTIMLFFQSFFKSPKDLQSGNSKSRGGYGGGGGGGGGGGNGRFQYGGRGPGSRRMGGVNQWGGGGRVPMGGG